MAAARIESSARLKLVDSQRDVPGSTHDDLEAEEVVGIHEAWEVEAWTMNDFPQKTIQTAMPTEVAILQFHAAASRRRPTAARRPRARRTPLT